MSKSETQKGRAQPGCEVVAIRKGFRVRKSNRHEDEPVIAQRARILEYVASLSGSQMEGTAAGSDASHARAAVEEALRPTKDLRCIHSTLDERNDFLLRCAEVKLLKAERDVHDAKHEQQRLLAGDAWWGSDTQNRMLSKGHKHWERYRDGIQVLAATPARTQRHLKQKRELIGRLWLGAEGEWYDQLRAGIAADVEWLRENVEPVRRRRRPF